MALYQSPVCDLMMMEIGTTPVSTKFSAKETKMSTSRLLSLLVTVVLIVLGVFTFRAAIATSEVVSVGHDLSDYFQRHPITSVAIARADLSDYFLRHPASAIPAASVASDWFERHSSSVQPVNAVDLSDYFQRHPDTTITNAAEAGASDWFERHPPIVNPGNAADLSDYYQRHPGVGPD